LRRFQVAGGDVAGYMFSFDDAELVGEV